MNSITIINGLLILILVAALRKLVWCLRWLWCYYHGKDVPDPIVFLPQRSGRGFEQRLQDAEERQNK